MADEELTALDHRAAVEIMGWEKNRNGFEGKDYWYGKFGKCIYTVDLPDKDNFYFIWQPTRDLNHAGLVKEMMRKRFGFVWYTNIVHPDDETFQLNAVCRFIRWETSPFKRLEFEIRAESEPLAIVQAALLAVESLKNSEVGQ